MIVIKNDFTIEQQNIISEIAESAGVSFELAKIMFSRGIDSAKKAHKFLHPGKHNFYDPFLLSGMQNAVSRIAAACDNAERIVVFGDYDADGICASTVLSKALKEYGIEEVFTVVPERSQGYGLSHDLVESMLEKYEPDLVITVDCGISCAEEVGYIEDLGIDVIVTDHHEIPDVLPDCTVINCKLKNQNYPFDCLCGAGVAYKLAYALLGERADKYLDLVTIATIADSMVLLDENRDIVYEGLKLIKNSPCAPLAKIIEKSGLKDVTSTGLAFTVAPRINAAGRMGDAASALNLMLECDEYALSSECDKLNDYNVERQNLCDVLLKEAKEMIGRGAIHKKCIVLAGEKWNSGLVGIVAAKLVEEYNRPVVLFSEKDGVYHGSARSIDGVNVYLAINACKNTLVDFGGHAQAAGITVTKQNLPLFERAFSEYLDKTYGQEVFVHKTEVEDMIEKTFTLEFALELNKLEPFGTGNRRPVFCVRAENINAYPIKPGSPHISFRTEFIDFLYFNGDKKADILNAPVQKLITFEPNVSSFNGRYSLKGYVKNIEYKITQNERLCLECFKNDLLSVFNSKKITETADNQLIAGLLGEANEQNILFSAQNANTLQKYGLSLDKAMLFKPDNLQSSSQVVISLKDFNGGEFDKVVYLDKPFGGLAESGVKNYIISEQNAFDYSGLSVKREVFGEVFKLLKYNRFYGTGSVDVALGIEHNTIDKKQIIFCLEVFLELKIFSFVSGTLQCDTKVKSDLFNSKIYLAVSEYLKNNNNA